MYIPDMPLLVIDLLMDLAVFIGYYIKIKEPVSMGCGQDTSVLKLGTFSPQSLSFYLS
jgi:hypothetical protein